MQDAMRVSVERFQNVQIFASEEIGWVARCKPAGKRIFSDADLDFIHKKYSIIGSRFNQNGYTEITVYKQHISEIMKIGRQVEQTNLARWL